MEPQERELHADSDAARAGSTPHIVRWILLISLAAAIILLSLVWITGAATQGDEEEEATISAIAEANESSGTDSIVIDDAANIEAAPESSAAADTPLQTVEN